MSDLQDQMGFHLRSGTQMTWRMMLRLMQKWGGKVKSRRATSKQQKTKIQNLNNLKQGGSQSMEFMDRNFGFTHLDMKKLDASVDWDKLEKVLKDNHVNFYRESSLMAEVSYILRFYQVLTIPLKDLFKSIKETAKAPEKAPTVNKEWPIEKDLKKAETKQEEIKAKVSATPASQNFMKSKNKRNVLIACKISKI